MIPIKYITKEEERQDRPAYNDGKLHTALEARLVMEEKLERINARNKYVAGIQGRDGGCFSHR